MRFSTAATNPGGGANANEVVAPGYVQTYFPNTTDYTRAAAIEVLPGSEVSAMNFTMVRQQRFHVKGHVIDLTTGKPPQVAQLSLSPRNSAVAQNPLDAILGAAAGTGANYNSAEGTFDLRDVAPGSYWLQTLAQGTPAPGAAQGAAGAAAAALASITTAIQPIEVSGADVDNLTIAVGGGIAIPGRIQVEGTPPPAFGFDRIALALNAHQRRRHARLVASGRAARQRRVIFTGEGQCGGIPTWRSGIASCDVREIGTVRSDRHSRYGIYSDRPISGNAAGRGQREFRSD